MREKKGKILGTVLFILLISCILYLSFFPAKKIGKGELTMVEISGNTLLSEKEYLTFTRLNDLSFNKDLSLPVLKDRIEKHPYISRADIESNGSKAKIVISEKKVTAVLLSSAEPYFISEDFQVLPMFSNTKFEDLPVISNPAEGDAIRPLNYFRNEDVTAAFKIIEAAKKVNMNIYKRLSEIDLNEGKHIILRFSGIKTPFIFGRGEEAKKLVYLEIMWDSIIDGNGIIQESDYIDLRFADEIYIGKNDRI